MRPRWTRRLRLLQAACVLATLPGAAEAAAPARSQPRDTLHLTLDEALAIARRSNPGYRQALNAVALNGTEMRSTLFGQVLPRTNLTLFQTQFTGNLTRRATDNFGNPIEAPVSDWTYFSQTNQVLDLTWQIQGRSIVNALSRQRLANRDRDVAEVEAWTGVDVAVRRAFMDALEQRDLMRTEAELLEARRLDRSVAQRLFELAMKSRVDVLNADLAVEQQALALRRQQAAYEQALLTLRTALGDPDLGPVALEGEPLSVFDPARLDADGLVARALEVNPRLRRARLAVRTADVGLRQAKQAWWPALFVNFNVARRAQTIQGDALFDLSFDEDLDQRFGIGLSLPMFNDYFGNRQAIQRSAVELDNRREDERAERLRIEQEVRGAFLELQNQYESLRLAERSAEIAGEALALAREEYRLGARSFEDLRAGFDQEADTRRQVIQARAAFADAVLGLEEAVGERLREAEEPGGGGS